jgi:hypothetical protein
MLLSIPPNSIMLLRTLAPRRTGEEIVLGERGIVAVDAAETVVNAGVFVIGDDGVDHCHGGETS